MRLEDRTVELMASRFRLGLGIGGLVERGMIYRPAIRQWRWPTR